MQYDHFNPNYFFSLETSAVHKVFTVHDPSKQTKEIRTFATPLLVSELASPGPNASLACVTNASSLEILVCLVCSALCAKNVL